MKNRNEELKVMGEKAVAVFDLDGTLVETDAANSAAYRDVLNGADALKCVLVNRKAFEKVILLTDSAERRAMETLRYHGLIGYFDEIVCNGGVGDKYANYFKSFDSDPAACVVWENEEGKIKSAIAAGVKVENMAVIGLLNPTEQIAHDEREIVSRLVADGTCILSGLALGCDSIGHRETLDHGGKTVAFLSSPLDEVNPPSNRPLAEEIFAKGGLLVSEYYEKSHSRNEFLGRYAERDRLQTMFAGGVILAASYSQKDRGCDSGSRFAMGKAREYGVHRYVVYDQVRDAGNPMYNLSREEIAAGAKIIVPGGKVRLIPPSVECCRQGIFWD